MMLWMRRDGKGARSCAASDYFWHVDVDGDERLGSLLCVSCIAWHMSCVVRMLKVRLVMLMEFADVYV